MAEENSIFNNLEMVKSSIEKKKSFADAIASLTALIQDQVLEDPSEKLMNQLGRVLKRIGVLLRTRHTSPQAWEVCLKLFEVATVRFGSTALGKAVATIVDECKAAFVDTKLEFQPRVDNRRYTDRRFRYPAQGMNVPLSASEVAKIPIVMMGDDVPPPHTILTDEDVDGDLGSISTFQFPNCWGCRRLMLTNEQVMLLPCRCVVHAECGRIHFAILNYCGWCRWELLTGDPLYDWKIVEEREAWEEIEGSLNSVDDKESFYG